jgi:hypothetical protein
VCAPSQHRTSASDGGGYRRLERLIEDVISTNARLDDHLAPAGG